MAAGQGPAGRAAALRGFDASGVLLLGRVPLDEFPSESRTANDVWGYVSPSGREYAIIGLERGTGFVEVTNPSQPVVVADIPDASSIWSDIAVFRDFAYNVNESGGGIQIIDMTNIDSSVVALRGSAVGGVAFAHNVFANTESGFLYACDTNVSSGFVVFDLSDPADPQPVGVWSEPGAATHDIYVTNYEDCPYAGRDGPCEIAFSFSGGAGLKVVDVTDKADLVTIATATYPNLSFCHQGWPTESREYLLVDDEGDELRHGIPSTTYVLEISNLADPRFMTSFTDGVTSIDHNLMVRGDFVFQANYSSGLRVFDISDPLDAQAIGYFDTSAFGGVNFEGAWGVYSQLPSGVVLVSDQREGLFVFDVMDLTGCQADSHCNDGAPCTADTCGENGECVHVLEPPGSACDDGDPCTIDGLCDSNGGCVATDVNLIACANDDACAVGQCDLATGLCACFPCTQAAQPLEDALVVAKGRAISFVPTNPGQLTALRVTFSDLPPPFDTFSGEAMWVGEPQEFCELGGAGPADVCPDGTATFTAAPLTCEPFFSDWAAVGPLNIYGEWIVPGALYGVQAISRNCFDSGSSTFSLSLDAGTSAWGDVVEQCITTPCTPPDGRVDIVTDILAIIAKFGSRPGAPAKIRVDLEPGLLDMKINIADVTFALDAFRGLPYPFAPSTTTPCD